MNAEGRKIISDCYIKAPEGMQDKENYLWTDRNLHVWNDMNEPAVFDPVILEDRTLPKSGLHLYDGRVVEHRDCHNLYAYFSSQATYDGLLART